MTPRFRGRARSLGVLALAAVLGVCFGSWIGTFEGVLWAGGKSSELSSALPVPRGNASERFWDGCRAVALSPDELEDALSQLETAMRLQEAARASLRSGEMFRLGPKTQEWIQFQSLAADLGPDVVDAKKRALALGEFRVRDSSSAMPTSLSRDPVMVDGEQALILLGPVVETGRLFLCLKRSRAPLLFDALRHLAALAQSDDVLRVKQDLSHAQRSQPR